jgi:hypothetical protein
VAHLHGRPWKPHQRLGADLAGERLPSGAYAYPIVVFLFPRQVGKTTMVHDIAIGRCLQYPDYRAAYAAQTGHVTTQRFGDLFTELERSPLASHVRPRRSAGTERVTVSGRSYLMAFPPKAGSLRSWAGDLVIVDEAQEHDQVLGRALDQTIIPVFTTRRRRQLIVVGTAGTDRSDYLRRYLDHARAGQHGYAVLEYGVPAGVECTDQVMIETHPGLASGLTDLDALHTAATALGTDGYAREYGNVWQRTHDRLFDPADWSHVQLPADAPRPTGRVCLSLDITPDRSRAAVAVAADDGYVELVDLRPGVEWLVGRLLELQARHRAPIAVDRYGATATVADALTLAGADLVMMGAAEVAQSAAGFLDAVRHRTVRVYPSAALSEAVDGAVKRMIGDAGGFTYSRRNAVTVTAPLVAVSHARWGVLHSPPPVRPAVHAM